MATLIGGGLGLAVFLVVMWKFWRALSGDEQMEPGGSDGRQLFGRYREPEKPKPQENDVAD